MKNFKRIAIIILLSLALLGSLALNAWWHWQIRGPGGWRDAVQLKASMQGTLQALADFKQGQLKLLVIQGQRDSPVYTGSNDGPFHVWAVQYYPTLGVPHRYATEEYVKSYNRKMRYMYAHPDQFPRPTNDVTAVDLPIK